MINLKLNSGKQILISLGILLIILSLIFQISSNINPGKLISCDSTRITNNVNNEDSLEFSAVWATINITSSQLNLTRHYHNDTIIIEGNLKYNNGSGVKNEEVGIFIDDIFYPQFTAITNPSGDFQVDFTIPYNFDIYSISGYKIQVNVTDTSKGKVIKENYLIIHASANSYFDIDWGAIDDLSTPKLVGEQFRVEGYLRDDNDQGIPDAQITYNWYNSSYKWSSDSFFTDFIGSLTSNLLIPTDVYSQTISLNLSYSGDSYYIGSTEITISKVILFSDVIWQKIEIPTKASEGDNITISGQIISRDNTSLKLYNRTVIISHAGNQVDAVETDSNGFFTSTYRIPSGAGFRTIRISLANTGGFNISIEQDINVSAAVYVPRPSTDLPPFFLFSVIFFPILAVIVGLLIVYGIRYYKKQEKESRVVDLPLESKLINLKILKDTGRLEESLSYLFNAIFMDLIYAKYGRIRKETETIRDFAIISVKELKLTPAAIYPFIQKVEEVIYARPYKITDNDFYETCGLFSPIYFQLTGYNFVLNF